MPGSDNRQQQVETIISNVQLAKRDISLRRTNNKCHRLTFPQMGVLFALRDYGQLRSVKLASLLHVSPGAVTQLVQMLEDNKFVTRRADQSDRRAVYVRLTHKGKRYLEGPRKQGFERIYKAFESLSEAELKQLVGITTKLAASAKKDNS